MSSLFSTFEITVPELRERDFILPCFQRGYVWDAEMARGLVETMSLGLPIGSIVLRSSNSTSWPEPPFLVIDGQQRISTLLGAVLNKGHAHEICVDTHGDVVVGSGKGRVPVRVLGKHRSPFSTMLGAVMGFDMSSEGAPTTFTELRREGVVVEDVHFDKAQALEVVALNIVRCKIPAIVFHAHATDAQIRESFRRINTGGVAITPEQLDRLLEAAP